MLTKTFSQFSSSFTKHRNRYRNASGTKSSTCNISNAGALRQMSLFHVSFVLSIRYFSLLRFSEFTVRVDNAVGRTSCDSYPVRFVVRDVVNIFKRREWV